MIYELKGELLEQALDYLEELKTWHNNTVVSFIKDYVDYSNPEKYKVTLATHPMMPSTISGVTSKEPLDKPWVESNYPGYYVPYKRSKAGKELTKVIQELPAEPEYEFLYKALGFEETYFHVSGNTYASIPLSVHGKLGKAFIKWKDNYPEINHPDLVEITHTEYNQIVGKD